MKYLSTTIEISSNAAIEQIDITGDLINLAKKWQIKQGLLSVFCQHTTAAIVLNESCPALKQDLVKFLARLAEPGKDYSHDKVATDSRANTHSHLLAHVLPSSQTVPVINGKLALGEWQRFFFIELDGPRARRTIIVHFLGEISYA